jgi:DNA (cytosine-5)-methyltransferase 1
MNAPTVVSLFAGCGGSTLGYQLAGFRELLAVEWDDNAVATFRLNFPDVPVYHGDIAALSVEECLRLANIAPGELDILDGSPPCQGFSTAGKRILDDPRNGLFREYVRLLRGLRPKTFVMENVAGLVQGKMRLIFAEIMRELKALGYRVRAALMNAMYFGVAQDRRRVIIIGVREDLGVAPSHPTPRQRPIAIREVLTPPPGTIGYITASNERHTLAGRLPLRYADRPAPTLVKTGNSRMMAGWRVEPITVHEASRFASFPDTFQWRQDAIARIGNTVPPNFMRAIAEHIRDHILAPAIGQAVPHG